MVCDSVLEYITDYQDYILSPEERQIVDEHLETCPFCRGEYAKFDASVKTIRQSGRSERQGISAGQEFEDRMREALKGEKRERRWGDSRLKRAAFIAAAVILCFTLAVFSPASAAIQSSISDMLDFAFRDKGIANSLELGLGQVIEQSVTDNDLTFTVHNFISDKNRSIILYSAKYNGVLEQPADDMRLNDLSVSYQAGRSGPGGYSSRLHYDQQSQQLDGNLDLLGNGQTNEMEISFSSAVLYQQKYVPIDLQLTGETMRDLNLVVKVDLPEIEKVVIKNIIVKGDRVIVEYDIIYTDPKNNHGGISLNMMCNPEEGFLTDGSRSESSFSPDTSYCQLHYNLNNADLSKCWLELTYPEPVKTINGDWRINFQPDTKAAKASNKTAKINRKFTVGENEFKVTKIDFSPSATVVHVEGIGISPLEAMDINYLKTKDGTVYQASLRTHNFEKTFFKDVVYDGEYTFDPVRDPKGMSMGIARARLSKEVNAETVLDTQSLNEQSVMLDGEEFLISFSEMDGKGIVVTLKNQYPVFQYRTEVKADGIYLIDSDGNRLYPEENRLNAAKNINIGNLFSEEFVFTFKGAKPGKYTLFIDSIEKYRNIDLEVDLLD